MSEREACPLSMGTELDKFCSADEQECKHCPPFDLMRTADVLGLIDYRLQRIADDLEIMITAVTGGAVWDEKMGVS